MWHVLYIPRQTLTVEPVSIRLLSCFSSSLKLSLHVDFGDIWLLCVQPLCFRPVWPQSNQPLHISQWVHNVPIIFQCGSTEASLKTCLHFKTYLIIGWQYFRYVKTNLDNSVDKGIHGTCRGKIWILKGENQTFLNLFLAEGPIIILSIGIHETQYLHPLEIWKFQRDKKQRNPIQDPLILTQFCNTIRLQFWNQCKTVSWICWLLLFIGIILIGKISKWPFN